MSERVRVARQARDQIGHWVAPASMRDHPCPHSCCMGKRPHPANMPVRLDRKFLRSLSEPELERELGSYQRYSDTHEDGFLQIVAEFRRREGVEERAHARSARARDRRAARNQEHSDEVYRQWLAAENATRGVMLNKAGERDGVNERTLFTGPASRVRKYASPELREWFEQRGRPTAMAFRMGGQKFDIYQ